MTSAIDTGDENLMMTEDHDSTEIYKPDTSSSANEILQSDPKTTTSIFYNPIVLDIQLIQTTSGYLIKELAYKTPHWPALDKEKVWPLPDRSLHYACYRHNPVNVPLHRTVKVDGRLCDRYTGLEINCGDKCYSDEHVFNELRRYDLIFLKGHNKKRVLEELFTRNALDDINCGIPKVVNVDSMTMDDEDAIFCKQNFVSGGAKFSFKFVYQRFPVYLRLMNRRHDSFPTDLPIYLSNVIVSDERYDPLALGRPLWICPYDHRCGESWFSSQRCAALNVGLLETLWFLMRDTEYRKLVRATTRDYNGYRNCSKAQNIVEHTNSQVRHYQRHGNRSRRIVRYLKNII